MFAFGWLLSMGGLACVLLSYLGFRPEIWMYLGWVGVVAGIITIYVTWR